MDARKVDSFDRIDLDFDAEVVVRKGDVHQVSVSAQESLQELIQTESDGGTLELTTRSCIDSQDPIRIEVTMPDLRSVEVSGSGGIVFADTFMVEQVMLKVAGSGSIRSKLVAAEVEGEIAGSGEMVLEGSANELTIEINGSGTVKAMALPCNTATVRINGSGELSVYVIKMLSGKVNGSGTVHYRGKPELSAEVNGSGKFVDEN
jgi:hypothetical protein